MNARLGCILLAMCAAFAASAVTPRKPDPSKKPELFSAIERGKKDDVVKLLDSGTSPDTKDSHGVNALYFACDKSQPDIARLLVERGADVNMTPPHGSSALRVAIYRGFDAYKLKPVAGYPELIRLLIDKGANVNAADANGDTPLIAAAEKDDVATLRLLLQHGVDLGHANAKGWTALDRAVAYLRRTIAHELVRAGAPLDDEQQRQKRNFHFARQAAGWFPFILIGSLLIAAWMGERFRRLPKRTALPRMGDDLPRLRELKCNACGGSASLRPGAAICSHCREPVPVPEDYTATLTLRAKTVRLMGKAVRVWKHVRIASAAPVRWLLWIVSAWFVWLMAKGLFPRFVREALYDLMTFRGTMAWALGVLTMAAIPIALCGYALYLLVVRQRLPAMPVIGKNVGEAETANCPNCGAMVEMKPGDLVGVCGYCGGETYRVALARQARGVATEEKDDATLSLYQAMVDVYSLRKNAAMAVPMAMVVIGIGLVVLLRVALFFL